mgnify:CR=1 FL=1
MNAPSPKVLLIEDEKLIRRFVRAAVEEEGCQVSEAETMAQGLIDAGLRKPDLLTPAEIRQAILALLDAHVKDVKDQQKLF